MSDATKAEAIRTAHAKLISLGWKFSVNDIGKNAGYLLYAMESEIKRLEIEGK